MKTIAYTCILLAAATGLAVAQTTVVNMDSGSHQVMDQGATFLTAGAAGDGNGAVLQLGYFNAATTANNFAGTFVPLTGQGSANTFIVPGSAPPIQYNQTSIGDRNSDTANTAGTFSLQLLFGNDPTNSFNLP